MQLLSSNAKSVQYLVLKCQLFTILIDILIILFMLFCIELYICKES